MIGVKMTVYRL